MASEERAVSAADPAALERYIMDVCQPKNEQEWWAASEIATLRARIAELERERDEARDALSTLSGEVQGLEYVISEVYAKQIADCECGGGDCEACRIMGEDVRTGRERWESLAAQLAAEKERADRAEAEAARLRTAILGTPEQSPMSQGCDPVELLAEERRFAIAEARQLAEEARAPQTRLTDAEIEVITAAIRRVVEGGK